MLRAYELVEGGAVILDEATGLPLPIEPGRFRDAADGQAFIDWLGEPSSSAVRLRASACTWQEARSWLPCPTCSKPGARVLPGQAVCPSCGCDAEFERQSRRSA